MSTSHIFSLISSFIFNHSIFEKILISTYVMKRKLKQNFCNIFLLDLQILTIKMYISALFSVYFLLFPTKNLKPGFIVFFLIVEVINFSLSSFQIQ